jgi:hypothetical protein
MGAAFCQWCRTCRPVHSSPFTDFDSHSDGNAHRDGYAEPHGHRDKHGYTDGYRYIYPPAADPNPNSDIDGNNCWGSYSHRHADDYANPYPEIWQVKPVGTRRRKNFCPATGTNFAVGGRGSA